MSKNKVIEYDVRQRTYDRKWELLGKFQDHENSYTYVSETNQKETHTPEKWVTLRVFDLLAVLED